MQNKNGPAFRRAAHVLLATETANLADNLPDGVTTGVAICVTREKEHLADLLYQNLSREDNWIVTDL